MADEPRVALATRAPATAPLPEPADEVPPPAPEHAAAEREPPPVPGPQNDDAPPRPSPELGEGDEEPAPEPPEGEDVEGGGPDDEEPEETTASDDDEEDPPVARDDEPLRWLKPSPHVLIVTKRNVHLRESAYQRVLAVAERYHAATGKKLIITGGDRTPLRQAELMHRKLAEGENLLHLYKQSHLVRPLMEVFERSKHAGWGPKRTTSEMGMIIEAQVKKGEYVSRHLAHTAVDVRSRGLGDEQIAALKAAVEEVKGTRLVDERDTEAPHFHLSL